MIDTLNLQLDQTQYDYKHIQQIFNDKLEFIADNLGEKYHILTAADGSEALTIIEQDTVHLVVSDVMMAVMDGFELCKRVKSDFHYSHIPVILLTAKDTMQAKIQGLELGADAYIEKPFSPQHLQVQIANLLVGWSLSGLVMAWLVKGATPGSGP